jgi:hypothetical protein
MEGSSTRPFDSLARSVLRARVLPRIVAVDVFLDHVADPPTETAPIVSDGSPLRLAVPAADPVGA